MQKKWKALICALAMSVCFAACGDDAAKQSSKPTKEAGNETETEAAVDEDVSLTEEEKKIIEEMGDDVQIISEADYPATVTELSYHVGEYDGQVFQLEGIYTTETFEGGYPYVYRVLNNNGEKTNCGLAMEYIEKEIPEGAWVRVTAIVSSAEINGVSSTVLQVVAIETLSNAGNAELTWDGSEHGH